MEELQLKIYNTENYILTDVKDFFLQNGYLNTFDFFCIIIWKANRAKSKIANRLLKFNPNLDESVKDLTTKIYQAETDGWMIIRYPAGNNASLLLTFRKLLPDSWFTSLIRQMLVD